MIDGYLEKHRLIGAMNLYQRSPRTTSRGIMRFGLGTICVAASACGVCALGDLYAVDLLLRRAREQFTGLRGIL
jgi:hypothetical protein